MTVRDHFLHVTEAMVMDLWDAGRSLNDIIATTGLHPEYARKIVRRLDVDGPEDRVRESAIRNACACYASALAATGKVYA